MNAEELMIGDWVYCTNTCKNAKVVGIYKPNDNYRIIVISEDDIELAFCEKNIQPIPLTAEILEKNGFVISNEEPVIDEIGVSIIYGRYKRIDEDQCTNYGDGLYPIKYVHELQHALRLCGIKKEITL